MNRIYGTPLTSGSDAYLNELAVEYTEDQDDDTLPTHATTSHLPVSAPPPLETLAAIARAQVTGVDESPGAEAGSVQGVDDEEVVTSLSPIEAFRVALGCV